MLQTCGRVISHRCFMTSTCFPFPGGKVILLVHTYRCQTFVPAQAGARDPYRHWSVSFQPHTRQRGRSPWVGMDGRESDMGRYGLIVFRPYSTHIRLLHRIPTTEGGGETVTYPKQRGLLLRDPTRQVCVKDRRREPGEKWVTLRKPERHDLHRRWLRGEAQ
jgi:hypothetical protein